MRSLVVRYGLRTTDYGLRTLSGTPFAHAPSGTVSPKVGTCAQNTQPEQKGISHGSDIDGDPNPVTAGRAALLAVQSQLGIRSQRHPRTIACGAVYPDALQRGTVWDL